VAASAGVRTDVIVDTINTTTRAAVGKRSVTAAQHRRPIAVRLMLARARDGGIEFCFPTRVLPFSAGHVALHVDLSNYPCEDDRLKQRA
jgi:hypothetical protein